MALTSGQALNLPLPQTGVLTVGPFTTATGTASGTALSLGTAVATIQPDDSSGNPVGSPLTLSCAAPSPPVVLHLDTVTPAAAPVVASIAPTAGAVAGGTAVTLT